MTECEDPSMKREREPGCTSAPAAPVLRLLASEGHADLKTGESSGRPGDADADDVTGNKAMKRQD